jgi:hypothetical protein
MAPGFADIVIAATARFRGLTIPTRNARHFEPLDVLTLNPFVRLPSSVLTTKSALGVATSELDVSRRRR